MPLSHLMVVDIETIPDTGHHEGDGFPKLPYHQVVAVAFLQAGIKREGETETFSAGVFVLMDFCLIFVLFSHYDEPEILRYAINSICPKGADVRHWGRAEQAEDQADFVPALPAGLHCRYLVTGYTCRLN